MFKAERLQTIQELLKERKQIDVNTLSNLLNVSNVTIRSDLKTLEEQGAITRTHGGAILKSEKQTYSPLLFSSDFYSSPKAEVAIQRIAEYASTYINDNDWIFLGSGTTCCTIAKALINREVHVVTNNLLVGYLLSGSTADVILCGGKVYMERIPFLSGDLTLNNLSSMYFNKAFVGVSAIDFKWGYSVSNDVECNIFKFLQDYSKEIIIVTDSSKFEQAAFMSIGGLDIADTVISDKDMPAVYQDYYTKNKINLYLV